MLHVEKEKKKIFKTKCVYSHKLEYIGQDNMIYYLLYFSIFLSLSKTLKKWKDQQALSNSFISYILIFILLSNNKYTRKIKITKWDIVSHLLYTFQTPIVFLLKISSSIWITKRIISHISAGLSSKHISVFFRLI